MIQVILDTLTVLGNATTSAALWVPWTVGNISAALV